jgi:hypothetical protein
VRAVEHTAPGAAPVLDQVDSLSTSPPPGASPAPDDNTAPADCPVVSAVISQATTIV